MSKLITDSSALISTFPYALTRDTTKEKLAEAVAGELAATIEKSEYAKIFPQIDTLPEEVLDILAYDLKIDWYEVDAPVENKRQAVKECMLVHKFKGTKYAVETALHSVYKSAEVKEWFEYDGEPYHFKVKVYGSSHSDLNVLYSKLQYAKNLRSVLDTVDFELVPDKSIDLFFGAAVTSIKKCIGARLEVNDGGCTLGTELKIGLHSALLSKKLTAKLEC